MTTTIRFREDLYMMAEKILAEKSRDGEAKASKDLMIVENLLRSGNRSVFDYHAVNERLHRDYPAIEVLEHLSDNIGIPSGKKTYLPKPDSMESQLLMDKCGIYATLLIKHEVINDARKAVQEYTVG